MPVPCSLRRWRFVILIGCAFVALDDANSADRRGGDWPMWRYDAQRSAAAIDNELPAQLELLWAKQFSARRQTWDDPLNRDLMTYDRVIEPIVMNGRLFVGFNDSDKLTAFAADTGAKLWSVYADAPVRLPPVGWEGSVYFCSDDGFLYCVDATSGELQWKFFGAPSHQKAIGNRRITSAWPARGGPVIRDGTVYFTASIWPFMGTFIYALDARTGEVAWVNDSTGSQYIKQPHSAPSFAGVAPQGALVATDKLLLVPGGRSVPAAFERSDGTLRYFEINAGGKGTGGSFLSADDRHFYVHTRYKGTRAFNLNNGIKTAFMPNEPVLCDGMIYSAEQDDGQPVVRGFGSDHKLVWEVEADGTKDLILVGERLVAAGKDAITVIRLNDEKSASVEKSIPVSASVERLIAADEKLFAVTIDGRIMAFGEGTLQPSATVATSPVADTVSDDTQHAVTDLLSAGAAEGYAFWFGRSDTSLAKALYANSTFVELAVVDNNADSVRKMRRQLDERGQYGAVTVHHSDAMSYLAPKHVANMIFVDGSAFPVADTVLIPKLYESVRPYGGVMHLLTDGDRSQLAADIAAMELEQARIEIGRHGVIVHREGTLPGSADWTHQYGDVANTIKSNDSRVKLPLGVLWFGGSSNMDVLPRHGHGPPEQVIGGRLFIQGANSLSARDVYTGRVLWKREFDDLGTFDVYYDTTYTNTPLDTKYNQVHIPGANGRGTNYVVTEDRVYIVEGATCHVLDPATGAALNDIRLPKADSEDHDAKAAEHWGYLGVYKDVLIGGLGFANYRQRHGVSLESDKKLKGSKAGFGTKSFDRAASVALVGFDRHSGKVLWNVRANHSFWHNGIVAGGDQVYCLDRNPGPLEDVMRRRGIAKPDTYRIIALNYRTGESNWEIANGVFGTWLGYSEDHRVLLQAGASGSDRLAGEVARGMAVYSAGDGAVIWENESLSYTGPCILHNDLIITNTNSYAESAGAFHLKDGTQKLVPNPLTGDLQPWKLTRAYGCNNIIASENLLTFRSGSAGFYDLLTDGGTGNLGGFKSGCTSNLVVAGGVLNAPDYTRTCSCAYQNQTSLALVHMPEVELWSVNSAASVKSKGNRIDSVGLNFGAPGDRRDANGLLWLEYPAVAGPSPPLAIEFNDGVEFFQRHSSAISSGTLPWVLASGVENVTDVRIGLRLQKAADAAKENAGADGRTAKTAADTKSEFYRVRMFFGVGAADGVGNRVVDVYVQGKLVLENLTLSSSGKDTAEHVVHELPSVLIADELRLKFVPKQGSAILSGIEIVRGSAGRR